MTQQEPPLHRAVLEGHLDYLRSLSMEEESLLEQRNTLGFTALELAQLLDKRDCIEILKPGSATKTIKVQHEGESKPEEYSLKQVEKVFGVRYLFHLKFESYDELKAVIRNCPILLRTWVGKENRELGEKYRKQIVDGFVEDMTIKWINEEKAYGIIANRDLPAGAYVGEYTGLVRPLSRAQPDHNAYSFHYPTRLWSLNYYIIDALWQGNELRFLNHSEMPNLQPICLVERGLLHMSFLTNEPIVTGSELTFDYGADFWRHKRT